MAKKSSNSGGRDHSTTPSYPVARSLDLPRLSPIKWYRPETVREQREAVRTFDDRRKPRPSPEMAVTGTTGKKAFQQARALYHKSQMANPAFLAACAKRKIRKEVLHALKKSGKNGMSKRRTNFWSDKKC